MAEGEQSPTDTTNPASGILRDSYRVSFADVLRLGYARADHILLGDSNHDDFRTIWGALGKSETMVSLAESGVHHMFLELPHYRQGLVDEFQSQVKAGEDVDVRGFAHRFEHDDDVEHNRSRWRWNSKEETQVFLQGTLAPLLAKATRFGVDVHAFDYENGREQLRTANEAHIAVLETRDEIIRIRAEEDMSDPAVAERLKNLRTQFGYEKGVYDVRRQAYYNTRANDQNLAQAVNDVSKDQKTLSMLGFVHGSRMNDFEEFLDGRNLKIDIAVNRESYERKYQTTMDAFQTINSAFGQDVPELVYFLDEGIVATTPNTPPDLVNQIEGIATGSIEMPTDSKIDNTPILGKGIKWN